MTLFSSIQTVKLAQLAEADNHLATFAQVPYFRDCLRGPLAQPHLSMSDIYHGIFSHMPRWINHLMRVRNALVGVLGFATAKHNQAKALGTLKQGDDLGFITVLEISDDHFIGGSEDKHMQFYLSIRKTDTQVEVSTLVNKKTWIGRLYVNAILPFHWFIARTAIHQAIKGKRL